MGKLYEKKYSEVQIESMKKEHGSLFYYESKDGKWCLLKVATLKIIDAARAISMGSSLKFDETLVENCWIDGDQEFKTSDSHKLGLFDQIHLIIKKVDGELGEL